MKTHTHPKHQQSDILVPRFAPPRCCKVLGAGICLMLALSVSALAAGQDASDALTNWANELAKKNIAVRDHAKLMADLYHPKATLLPTLAPGIHRQQINPTISGYFEKFLKAKPKVVGFKEVATARSLGANYAMIDGVYTFEVDDNDKPVAADGKPARKTEEARFTFVFIKTGNANNEKWLILHHHSSRLPEAPPAPAPAAPMMLPPQPLPAPMMLPPEPLPAPMMPPEESSTFTNPDQDPRDEDQVQLLLNGGLTEALATTLVAPLDFIIDTSHEDDLEQDTIDAIQTLVEEFFVADLDLLPSYYSPVAILRSVDGEQHLGVEAIAEHLSANSLSPTEPTSLTPSDIAPSTPPLDIAVDGNTAIVQGWYSTDPDDDTPVSFTLIIQKPADQEWGEVDPETNAPAAKILLHDELGGSVSVEQAP